ncbi:MAG TPA: ATP-binding protein [Hyphomicrobiaceae bacterium]|nr:ATP-binding protein [Hyphomicrobiaceae bacterium]
MDTTERTGKRRLAREDLILLLLAAIASVAVLAAAAFDTSTHVVGSLRLGWLLAGTVFVGAAAAMATLVWRSWLQQRWRLWQRRDEVVELRRSLAAAEAIIKAEPQVLIFWQQGENMRVAAHTLTTVPGLPEDPQLLMRLGAWLEPEAARDLKAKLDTLFTQGQPFNLLLRTGAGGDVEADGRVSGGRAILRFRDIAGYRKQVAEIISQHRQLARDIGLGRALYNALPHPVWIRGGSGQIEWVNKAYVRAVGAKSEVEVTDRQLELLETRQREELANVLVRQESFRKRMPLIIGGERRHHDIVVLPFGEASVACAIDVTAIHSAESELDRLVATFYRTLDRVSTAVAIFSRDQRLSFFNEAFAKLWQLDADWLNQRPMHGELLDRLRERSRLPEVVNYREWKTKVLAGYKTGSEPEEWWHLPDGRALHVMAEERPDGGITYLYENETERLSLESRYNEMIRVQRETLDHLAEGVAVFGTDGRLKLFNLAFERIWKLGRRMLQDEPHIDEIIRQCQILHDDPAEWSHIAQVATALDQRQHVTGQMTRADQSVIDYAALPLPDGGTLVSFADVTVTKRYARALEERNEALVAADRLKSQFISHVSYELRTPLTSIIGFTELLESPRIGELNEKQREYLSAVSRSSETLLSTINDILDLANIDAGALELRLAPVKIMGIIEAAALGVKDRMSRIHLALEIEVAEDVDELIADEARVRQILYNLLSNAIGFSEPGGLIRLTCMREGHMIAFTVTDRGAGIPHDQQRDVLGRFVSRSRGSKHRGAGLGLPIVKSLVELHGGTMSLVSEPGEGTSVTVRFPEHGPRPGTETAKFTTVA